MAGFTETVKIVIDVVTGQSKGVLGDIRSSLSEAEGALGKVKAAGKGAFDALTSSPQALAAAGTAVAAFAVKSVQKFEETALAADKFRDATGASLDESSRWIAVADDVGIGAGTIQTAFQKMEKGIAANRAAFGDLVVTAKGGGTDLTKTFLNVVQHIQSIKDPIEQQAEAVKLFGKGFGEVSELVGTSADELRRRLEDVSDAQIIDEEEVQKARAYQAAMDNLSDSIGDLSREVGEKLAPAFAEAANDFAGLVNAASSANESSGGWLGFLAGKAVDVLNPIKGVQDAWHEMEGQLSGDGGKQAAIGFDVLAESAARMGEAIGPAGTSVGDLTRKTAEASVELSDLAGEAEVVGTKVDELGTKWDLLRGKLSVKDAALSLQDAFQKVEDSAVEAWNATATGADNAAEKVRDHDQAVNDLEQKIVDYGEKVLGLPPEQVTDILANIDEGDLASAKAALDKAAEARTAAFNAKENTGATSAVERAFENAARTRSAVMAATPTNTGPASGQLDTVAHSRQASIAAQATNTASADNALDNVARTRIANIVANIIGGATFGISKRAQGGRASGVTLVGEQGPELVDLPQGSYVHTARETEAVLSARSVQHIQNITMHLPPGISPDAVARASERYRLRNGSR